MNEFRALLMEWFLIGIFLFTLLGIVICTVYKINKGDFDDS